MSAANPPRSGKLDATVTQSIALSIVVQVTNGSAFIPSLVHSIERQQQAPPYEVLLVVDQITTSVERRARNWNKRLRLLQLDKKSVRRLHRFVITEAKGDLVLFLNDDCILDDPLFLRRHFDHHQRAPHAAGVGGRYTLVRGAGWSARTWAQRMDDRLTVKRVDALRCLQLPEYNASYKTVVLRETLLHSQIPETLSCIEVENSRLIAANHDLHLIDRLTVERQIRMNVWSLLKCAFRQGLLDRTVRSLNLQPKFRPLGVRLLQVRKVSDSRFIRSFACRVLGWYCDLAYEAGCRCEPASQETLSAPSPVLIGALFRQLHQRLASFRYSRAVTELFLTLKTCIERFT